jgi:predicted HTH transcriptional regulator
MLIDGKTIEELTEADLLQMVEIGRSEDRYLDFKRELYSNSDADSKEFLKDVSGLANASGGMLLLGVAETHSIASEVCGVSLENPQKQIESMEQKITHGLELTLSGVRIRAILLSSGKYVVAIAVPQSINRPHRAKVTKGG